jgi:NADPH:quinone reductase-like Zn-dependent oxidoreductase
MATIRAALVDPNVNGKLAISTVEAPSPRPDEALVRVHAISLNRGECNRAQNSPAGTLLGWDFSGVVEQAAANGAGPKAGDRVVGVLNPGAWAEQVVCPAANLAVLPDAVTFQQAATLPVAGLTALYALDRAPGLSGRNLLVTGASGGVGNFAIQLAKHGGATVTGLVRQERHAQSARDAGADHVVADETGEAAREFAPYGVILESVGGSVLANAISMLGPFGHMIVYGVSMGGPMTLDSSVFLRTRGTVSGLGVFVELQKETASVGLGRLARMVAAGVVKPLISVEAPWEQIGDVTRGLLDRSYPGKAVLMVS